jgi:hypothetical protein
VTPAGLLLPLLLTLGAGPAAVRGPEAVAVFTCDFDEPTDKNFDGWPDAWSRQRGPGFPLYVGMKIGRQLPANGRQCLRVDLDGGGAAAFGPPVPVSLLFSYIVQVGLRTDGLKFDRAYISITLLDEDGGRLRTVCSEKVLTGGEWSRLRVGPVSPDARAKSAVVGLHVEPQSREDLRGTVMFRDVRIDRLPRTTLETSDPQGLFTDPRRVEISYRASGFAAGTSTMAFRLEDALGRPLAQVEQPLEMQPAEAADGQPLGESPDGSTPLIGVARWRPPITGSGFYRVRAVLGAGDDMPSRGASPRDDRADTARLKASWHQQQVTFVVVEPQQPAAGGEFGWSLPQGTRPLPPPQLLRLLRQAGVRWVKYPLWYDTNAKDSSIESLVEFIEQLNEEGVDVVGLLSAPPPSVQKYFGHAHPLAAAEIFAPPPKVWYPSLEAVMGRLATYVRWWQLGTDKDTSFVGYPDLPKKIAEVKKELDRIGYDVGVGVGWTWQTPLPLADEPPAPWRFFSLSSDRPMTAAELAAVLDATKDETGVVPAPPKRNAPKKVGYEPPPPLPRVQRWLVLEPLGRSEAPVEARVLDMVTRMIDAKLHGAEAVFCPEPFDTDRGLMNDDGTPGELLLPWRTTALMLGGAAYLGSLQLPGGSTNHVFTRDGETVMVVWNERPARETLFLGENVQQVDLWGRGKGTVPVFAPAKTGLSPSPRREQTIQVDRLPTFVTGLDESLARFSIGLQLAPDRLPSTFDQPHTLTLTAKNLFGQPLTGRVTLDVPERWRVTPNEAEFRMAADGEVQQPFSVLLPYNTGSGRHLLRADFDVQGEQPRRISVYRNLQVGLGDVTLETATKINPKGELEVTQRLVNKSDAAVSFRCALMAPDRRRLATYVLRLDKGADEKLYLLPDGEDLLGKTLCLQVNEIGGARVLNRWFVAEK